MKELIISKVYFQASKNYFWQWEDRGEIVAIPNGSTIAYKKLIVEIIDRLSFQGLPSFGALLMAVAAINHNGKDAVEEIEDLLYKNIMLSDKELINDAISFLKKLTEIPEEYKTGHQKHMFLQTLFKDCHNVISVKKSSQIYQDFKKNNQFETYDKVDLKHLKVNSDLKVIALLNRKFRTAEEIIEKIADVPKITDEVNLEETYTDSNDFVDKLTEDSKTFRVGALVKTIWSGLHLPFHSSAPSQQPIGGVSDITNKGNLSQLLISEFANDDLVFLSRLANNEALYLNRETPPTSNELKRVILIDVSLKNWGTPKTVAFATMLAIAKHPKTDIACEVFAVGSSYKELKVNTVNDLIDGLQEVDVSLDASKGITEFFQQYPSSKGRELFLLTENSTLKQINMAKVLSDYANSINYLISNDATGKIDIYKKLKNSRKLLQHMELPLARLWQKTKEPESKPISRAKRNYYPVLVRNAQNFVGIRSAENGDAFIIYKERSLLRKHGNPATTYRQGWEIIDENLSFIPTDFEVGFSNNGNYLLLLFNAQNKEIELINLFTNHKKVFPFSQWKYKDGPTFIFFDNCFYHSNQFGHWQLDAEGNVQQIFGDDIAEIDELFIKRRKDLSKLKNTYMVTANVLRNLKKVAINDSGNLILNSHELLLNQGNHIKLERAVDKTRKVTAELIYPNIFEFKDGSRIEINKSGLILLQSSNSDIPEIFIPSVLDVALGIATYEHFAGYDYYLNKPSFNIFLEEAGNQKLNVIKAIRTKFHLTLSAAKNMVENAPASLGYVLGEDLAFETKKILEDEGAKIKIETINKDFSTLKTIENVEFFRKYVNAFTDTIIRYELENKTTSF
ncbi:MAG: hypothetical protein CMO01_21560 [Thalassobius sp.]|nr:hypothetical protein [Thalassovita sp.]